MERKVSILFDFKTKEEWISFFRKLLNDKVTNTYFRINILNDTLIDYGSLENYVEARELGNLSVVSSVVCYFSPSKKTVQIINDWIKNNHYESKYMAVVGCDGNRMKFWSKLDEFLLESDN